MWEWRRESKVRVIAGAGSKARLANTREVFDQGWHRVCAGSQQTGNHCVVTMGPPKPEPSTQEVLNKQQLGSK